MKGIKRIGSVEVVGGMTLNNEIRVGGVRIGKFRGTGRTRDWSGCVDFSCRICLDNGPEIDMSGYSYFADVLKNLPQVLQDNGVTL